MEHITIKCILKDNFARDEFYYAFSPVYSVYPVAQLNYFNCGILSVSNVQDILIKVN